jgi:hypothetical protein
MPSTEGILGEITVARLIHVGREQLATAMAGWEQMAERDPSLLAERRTADESFERRFRQEADEEKARRADGQRDEP